jgi:FMN phosphatase YigB (HAD superfamily)
LFFRVEAYHDFMIQAIVYDAVGTLIHVQPSVATIYATVGRRFGSQLEPDEIRQRFHAAFSRQDRLDEQAGWRTSETRELDRWRAIVLLRCALRDVRPNPILELRSRSR